MLTLTRKVEEKIVMLDRETGRVIATVLLARIDGKQVRLAIEAGCNIKILREELQGDLPATCRP